ASEIDIQRTKDGHYVVHHDDSLERLCGIKESVSNLTLAECKNLEVMDVLYGNGKKSELATLDEMLELAKGKIYLYIELKGESADERMADDLYRILLNRDMLDQVTVISLKYSLIEYLELTHPDVNTGFLCFVSLGDISTLQCDELLLEDEMATPEVIDRAHLANKKVYIWTINTNETLKKRMLDTSDGIITDEVVLAEKMYAQLVKRDDFTRIVDTIIFGFR
ncbi:MAG: glycerophosphodiester phosphodiesterase family protein, partial [Bacillota bacterium]|nr:glycerophosphodiester phosphodiesterase family protein [Bacillota bacterium]